MDINWIIAQLTPMLVRYGVFGICAALVAIGFTDEQIAGMNPIITQVVGGVVGLAVLVIAAKLKPSVKAAASAREIDKAAVTGALPADEDVVIQTVPGAPDIIVPAK